MEYIEGSRLKEALDKMSSSERLESCKLVGVQIARLHKNRIIHGDLTTSNMIVTADDKIFFIDFGLSFHSIELEDKGADLHLMRRALDSAHYKYAGKCFNAVIEGYAKELGKDAKSVLLKMKEIERRGRYFEER
jgi:TP53 regulating kinase-like protein